MIQTYSLLLWSEPTESNLDEMIEISFSLLSALKQYGHELSPKYLTARKKSEAKEFVLNRGNLKELIERSINKEGEKVFLDLGRHFSFFSSLKDNESCGISLTVGASNKNKINSLIVNLPYGGFSGFSEKVSDFENLVKRLVKIFRPYWCCVYNSETGSDYGYKLWEDKKPVSVHWLNYFNKVTAKNIGMKRVLALDGVEEFCGGYFYKLQDMPINVENPEHLARQKSIEKYLGLGKGAY